MRIICQRFRVVEAAQHHSPPAPAVDTHFNKEAAAVACAVVEVDSTLVISALGQVA